MGCVLWDNPPGYSPVLPHGDPTSTAGCAGGGLLAHRAFKELLGLNCCCWTNLPPPCPCCATCLPALTPWRGVKQPSLQDLWPTRWTGGRQEPYLVPKPQLCSAPGATGPQCCQELEGE